MRLARSLRERPTLYPQRPSVDKTEWRVHAKSSDYYFPLCIKNLPRKVNILI